MLSEYEEGASSRTRRSRPPRHQQLSEEVAGHVRELIISGAVKQGEFLRMEPIAEAVGVSNTPVREGLLVLRSEGFVRLVPRRGFVVASFSPQDIHDLFWAQGVLAGELVARATSRIDASGLDRLELLTRAYEEATARGDEDALPELGHRFHRQINLAADSQRLALLLGSVVKHLPNRFYAGISGQVLDSVSEHPLIVDAMRAGDADQARKVMVEHITGAADRLVDTLRGRGLWDDLP